MSEFQNLQHPVGFVVAKAVSWIVGFVLAAILLVSGVLWIDAFDNVLLRFVGVLFITMALLALFGVPQWLFDRLAARYDLLRWKDGSVQISSDDD